MLNALQGRLTMPRKRNRAGEIIHKLWEEEVALAQGKLTAEAKLDKAKPFFGSKCTKPA